MKRNLFTSSAVLLFSALTLACCGGSSVQSPSTEEARAALVLPEAPDSAQRSAAVQAARIWGFVKYHPSGIRQEIAECRCRVFHAAAPYYKCAGLGSQRGVRGVDCRIGICFHAFQQQREVRSLQRFRMDLRHAAAGCAPEPHVG